jgi:hypothetical protein
MLLLMLFVVIMIGGSIALYYFFNFIHPVDYVTQSLGEIRQPGKLEVMLASSINEPIGFMLISPSGTRYTQSSRDVTAIIDGSSLTMTVTTADVGEWKIRYRNITGVTTSLTRRFIESNAAILVDTKATKSKNNSQTNDAEYIVSMKMSCKNYKYTIKAIRRSDGFSLTSSGDGGATLNLEPYAYTGVWDFYLNTTRGDETYSTVFSYTF